MASLGHLMIYFYDPVSNGIYTSAEHYKRAVGPDADTKNLIELSEREHAAISQDLSRGRVLDFEGGAVKTVPPAPAPAALRRQRALNLIDRAADSARARDRSIGELLDIEYAQVIDAHARWFSAGAAASDVPSEIQAWATAEGLTTEQAALEIAESAAHRERQIARIREIRLEGKAAIRQGQDSQDFREIAAPFIARLKEI